MLCLFLCKFLKLLKKKKNENEIGIPFFYRRVFMRLGYSRPSRERIDFAMTCFLFIYLFKKIFFLFVPYKKNPRKISRRLRKLIKNRTLRQEAILIFLRGNKQKV